MYYLYVLKSVCYLNRVFDCFKTGTHNYMIDPVSNHRTLENIIHVVGGCKVVGPTSPEGVKIVEVTRNPNGQHVFKTLEDTAR